MKNPVIYWELAVHTYKETREFFEKVFEWTFEETGLPDYAEVHPEEAIKISGGVFKLRKAKMPFLTVYIRVQNIHDMALKIEKHGGYIKEAPFEVSKGTWICLFNEPQGTTFAMIEKK